MSKKFAGGERDVRPPTTQRRRIASPPLSALLVTLSLACNACAQSPDSDQWRAIAVTTAPAALGAADVGELHFVGGLELSSQDAAFGGLSDISIDAQGAFLAITDAGHWVRGQITSDESGAPTGVTGVEIAAMRDEAGAPFASKSAGDSEGMARMPDGRIAVSFEQNQVLRFYDLSAGPAAPARAGPPLAEIADLEPNRGLEALAAFADGRLLIGTENGSLWIAPPDAAEEMPPVAPYLLGLGYGLVDLDLLPSGDFIALERFYAPVIGNRIRITRFSAAALAAPSERVRKTELALFTGPLALDNFEGISVVPQPDGAVRLYLISDNNFNTERQRTLLYVFDLKQEEGGD